MWPRTNHILISLSFHSYFVSAYTWLNSTVIRQFDGRDNREWRRDVWLASAQAMVEDFNKERRRSNGSTKAQGFLPLNEPHGAEGHGILRRAPRPLHRATYKFPLVDMYPDMMLYPRPFVVIKIREQTFHAAIDIQRPSTYVPDETWDVDADVARLENRATISTETIDTLKRERYNHTGRLSDTAPRHFVIPLGPGQAWFGMDLRDELCLGTLCKPDTVLLVMDERRDRPLQIYPPAVLGLGYRPQSFLSYLQRRFFEHSEFSICWNGHEGHLVMGGRDTSAISEVGRRHQAFIEGNAWTIGVDGVSLQNARGLRTMPSFNKATLSTTSEFIRLPLEAYWELLERIDGAHSFAGNRIMHNMQLSHLGLPCETTDVISLMIGGYHYALDLESYLYPWWTYTVNGGTEVRCQTAILTAVPDSVDDYSPAEDTYILGLPFLTNVYATFEFRGWDNHLPAVTLGRAEQNCGATDSTHDNIRYHDAPAGMQPREYFSTAYELPNTFQRPGFDTPRNYDQPGRVERPPL